MAEQFLNTEVTSESKVTITLNFSADLDYMLEQDKTGYRSKSFEINKFKVYEITYVERTPHHNAELRKITGKIAGVAYATKRPEVINPVIYRTVEKHSPIKLDEKLEPTSFTVDASTEYKQDVRVINISDIRDFAEVNKVDLSIYERGDVLDIDMLGGDRYPMCIVRDIYEGDDFKGLIVDYILPLKEENEDGSVAEMQRLFLRADEMRFITLVQKISAYPFTLGDTVEITVAGEEEGETDVYRGTIMDMITIDQDDHYTPASVLGVMLKYTEQVGDQYKSNTRLFKEKEILSIMPFIFPRDNPDIVTVADEGWSSPDSPDDHEDMEIPPETTTTEEPSTDTPATGDDPVTGDPVTGNDDPIGGGDPVDEEL